MRYLLFLYLTLTAYNHLLFKIVGGAEINRVACISCYISVIDCGLPEHVPGTEDYIYTDTLHGSSFNFSCITGLVRSGVSVNEDYTVTCEENRRWSFGNLTCAGY